MLARRIIPCLDVKDGRVVKGVRFVSLRDAGDPVEVAAQYNNEGADEIVFLDITASFEKRPILIDVVRKTAETVFMPLTVGGGVRNSDDINELLRAGADKVSINTQALKTPELVKDASDTFGSQCIVVAIDAKKTNGSWQVYINGGRTPVEKNAIEWAQEVEQLGAGEILLTSMDYDGTKDGYDLVLTKSICDAVNIPVIASGGAGTLEHFSTVFTETSADAALAASIFHYQEISIQQVKQYLKKYGVQIRL
ncbi:imidazole glycerol phosphate synthase subunit HisF [Candidatus Omnitrophota bacterium]